MVGYLKEIEPPQREPKTYTAYKYCLQLFAEHCSKTYLQDVVRDDLLVSGWQQKDSNHDLVKERAQAAGMRIRELRKGVTLGGLNEGRP